MYSDTLKDFAFFQEHKIVFISVVISLTILWILWLIDNIVCVVTKFGLENLEELKNRTEEKKKETVAKLTAKQKKALKNQLSVFKKLKEIQS